MKLEQHIINTIKKYPSLYKDINWEKSRMKVLNHLFWAYGNGYEFAYVKNPKKGGYLTEASFYKRGDWVRKYDKPYNTRQKITPLPEDYFKTILTEPYDEDEVKRFKDFGIDLGERVLKSDYDFWPYPFSRKYSYGCIHLDKGEFLQEDWKLGLYDLIRESIKYFEDESRYINNNYYPNESNIASDFKQFKNTPDEKVSNLRKIWGYGGSEIRPTFEEIKNKKTKSWIKYRNNSLNYLYQNLNT